MEDSWGARTSTLPAAALPLLCLGNRNYISQEAARPASPRRAPPTPPRRAPPPPPRPAPPRNRLVYKGRMARPGAERGGGAGSRFPSGSAGRSHRSQKPPLCAPRPGPAPPALRTPTPRCRGPADLQTRGRERLCPWRCPGSGRRVPAGIRVRAGDAQPRKARSGVRAGCSARERRWDALAAVRGAPGDPSGSRGRSRARERGLWAPQPVSCPRSPRVPSAEAGASSPALGGKRGTRRGAPDPKRGLLGAYAPGSEDPSAD